MRESFTRVITWAREHPWIAALILGAVVVLGYLAYKRYGSSGTSSSDGELFAPAEETTGGAEAGFGEQSPLVSSGIAGGETSVPGASLPTIPPIGSSMDFPVPDYSGAYNDLGLSASSDVSGYATPISTTQEPAISSFATGSSAMSAASAIKQQGGNVKIERANTSLPSAINLIPGAAPAVVPVQAAKAGVKAGKALVDNIKKTVNKLLNRGTSGASGSYNFTQSNTSGKMQKVTAVKPVKQKQTTTAGVSSNFSGFSSAKNVQTKTPAQLLGYPYNWTGWIYSIYYVNGYPSNPIPTPVSTGGGRTAR